MSQKSTVKTLLQKYLTVSAFDERLVKFNLDDYRWKISVTDLDLAYDSR